MFSGIWFVFFLLYMLVQCTDQKLDRDKKMKFSLPDFQGTCEAEFADMSSKGEKKKKKPSSF